MSVIVSNGSVLAQDGSIVVECNGGSTSYQPVAERQDCAKAYTDFSTIPAPRPTTVPTNGVGWSDGVELYWGSAYLGHADYLEDRTLFCNQCPDAGHCEYLISIGALKERDDGPPCQGVTFTLRWTI